MSLGLALALLSPLAGCLAPASEVEPSGGADPAPTGPNAADDGGTIEGTIVTQELEYVSNAVVRLSQAGQLVADTSTDEKGRYTFKGLEPGEYVVQVSAPCCKEHVARVMLPPGDTLQVNARIEELVAIIPYVLEFEWTGFIGCAARIPGYGSPDPEDCQDLDPNTETRYEFKIDPGLQTIVVAMVWEQVTTSLQEELRLMMYRHPNTANANRFFFEEGTSPLEVQHGPGGAIGGEALNFTNMEKPWEVRFRVWPGAVANVVYQQPFTVYYHLYYVDPAREDASAVPG